MNKYVHFIGIGGISMSGIAQIMLKNGYKVTGSDRCDSNITEKLKESEPKKVTTKKTTKASK